MVLDGIGHGHVQAVVERVVAAHGALQLGELAHHVGHEVGLGQLRGQVGLLGQARVAQLAGNALGDGAHALHALALGAELVVIDHLAQPVHARGQGLLAVLVEEELGVGQARAHHAFVAADDGAGILGADVADHQELVGQLAGGVQQREVLLVGLHGEDQAFLRHVEEFLLELADQHIGTLDQGRDLVQQGLVLDGTDTAAHALGSRLQLARDLGTALGEAGDDGAFLAQLRGVVIGGADDHGIDRRLEAVAMRGRAGRQAQGLDADQHLGAVQHHQAVGRAHEMDAAPAVGQLVAHDLGDGQLGNGFVQRLLHAVGQHHAAHGGGVEQGLGLAFALAGQAGNGFFAGAQGGQLLDQGGRGLPSASRPTETGMSFCDTALSSAWGRTSVMWAARRRGEA